MSILSISLIVIGLILTFGTLSIKLIKNRKDILKAFSHIFKDDPLFCIYVLGIILLLIGAFTL